MERERAMRKIFEKLDPTLLDLMTGCLIYGIIGEIIILTVLPLLYEGSIWKAAAGFLVGVILMILASFHMYASLSTAIELGEAHAGRYFLKKYIFRVAVVLVIFFAVYFTRIINAVALVCGMLSLKVSAYLQPITHKIITKKFNEGR